VNYFQLFQVFNSGRKVHSKSSWYRSSMQLLQKSRWFEVGLRPYKYSRRISCHASQSVYHVCCVHVSIKITWFKSRLSTSVLQINRRCLSRPFLGGSSSCTEMTTCTIGLCRGCFIKMASVQSEDIFGWDSKEFIS
jgi:hypothetical protein